MPTKETKNFLEVFEMFMISQSAKGVADVTIRNYRYHMKNIGNYMDLDSPFDDVTNKILKPWLPQCAKQKWYTTPLPPT